MSNVNPHRPSTMHEAVPMTVTTGATKSRLSSVASGDSVQRLLALGALVILLAFFSVISTPFRTPDNYISILVATAVNGVLAMGVTFVIITGGIDLSVGTTMTFCTVVHGPGRHPGGPAAVHRPPGRARSPARSSAPSTAS